MKYNGWHKQTKDVWEKEKSYYFMLWMFNKYREEGGLW